MTTEQAVSACEGTTFTVSAQRLCQGNTRPPATRPSGRATIAVMQSGEVRRRDDTPALGRIDRSRKWRVTIEREMRAGVVVVREVFAQGAARAMVKCR